MADIESRVTSLEHRLVGVDGNNGLVSQVKTLVKLVGSIDVVELKKWGEDVWNNKRPETCIGKELLETYKEEHIKTHMMDVDMRKLAFDAEKARRDSRTTLIVAAVGSISAILVPIVMKVIK